MIKRHNKLVRDRVPELIEAKGETVAWHVATVEEYDEKLRFKLLEESEEFASNPCVEELADVLEVVEALIAHYGYDKVKVLEIMRLKREERGGFEERIILDEVH